MYTSLAEKSTQLHPLTGPTPPKEVVITRVFQDGVELNWLPPTEPNGEVHYVIYYTPEGGTEQSMDTGSDLTHYNLTGLERNRVYTNIAVLANNSAGISGRSAIIDKYNQTPPGELCTTTQTRLLYVGTLKLRSARNTIELPESCPLFKFSSYKHRPYCTNVRVKPSR